MNFASTHFMHTSSVKIFETIVCGNPDHLLILTLSISDFHWSPPAYVQYFLVPFLLKALQNMDCFQKIPGDLWSIGTIILSELHSLNHPPPPSLLNHLNSFCRQMSKFVVKLGVNFLNYLLGHCECDTNRVHSFTQWHLFANWVVPWESAFSCMCTKVSSDWLVKLHQGCKTDSQDVKMAGYFLHKPCTNHTFPDVINILCVLWSISNCFVLCKLLTLLLKANTTLLFLHTLGLPFGPCPATLEFTSLGLPIIHPTHTFLNHFVSNRSCTQF